MKHVVTHCCGFIFTAIVVGVLTTPLEAVELIVEHYAASDPVTLESIATHGALSGLIWATLFVLYKRISVRRKPVAVVRLATGAIMVETLVIFPLLLLLMFGSAQLAINNITGILANVAVYQAARAAWVWVPEETPNKARAVIPRRYANQKARTAAAMVMLPVAPGQYFFGDVDDDDVAESAWLAAANSHVPAGGALSDFFDLPEETIVLSALGQGSLESGSFSKSIGSSGFIRRTIQNFGMAYESTRVRIDRSSYEVTLTYSHFQTMPFVRRIFGVRRGIFSGSTLVPGYYSDFRRTYRFAPQAYLPNGNIPSRDFIERIGPKIEVPRLPGQE